MSIYGIIVIMKHLIHVLAFFLAATSYAGEDNAPNGVPWGAYHERDHFQWNNPTDVAHISLGFGIAYVGANALNKKAKMPVWEAALFGMLGSIAIESTREAFFSTYASKTDIKTWTAGALAGGITFTAINF